MSNYVVIQPIWTQTSCDYHAERGLRTLSVTPETTVQEIMDWALAYKGLGAGDIVLSKCEEKSKT